MASDSRLSQALSQLKEKLEEQSWYVQLKAKWEEMDPQSRTYLTFALLGAAALGMGAVTLTSMWSVYQLKNELNDKAELVSLIQNANEELRALREANPSMGATRGEGEEDPQWPSYLENTAAAANIDKGSLTVGQPKPGATTDTAKETTIEVALKKVNIKQVVKYAFELENGVRPVKIRSMSIDTNADPAGFMDATFSVSAFALKP